MGDDLDLPSTPAPAPIRLKRGAAATSVPSFPFGAGGTGTSSSSPPPSSPALAAASVAASGSVTVTQSVPPWAKALPGTGAVAGPAQRLTRTQSASELSHADAAESTAGSTAAAVPYSPSVHTAAAHGNNKKKKRNKKLGKGTPVERAAAGRAVVLSKPVLFDGGKVRA
jgi:hypothetical protein